MSNTEKKETLSTVLIVQTVTLLVAIIGVTASFYTTKVAKEQELETQLILNAYSLQDSAQQIKRLQNFCELKFFNDERSRIIEAKIKQGTMYAPGASNTSSFFYGDSVFICRSKKAHTFHLLRTCQGLHLCTESVEKNSLSNAVDMGKTPCHICCHLNGADVSW